MRISKLFKDNKVLSFLVNDTKLLQKYNKIWDKSEIYLENILIVNQ